MFHLPPASTRSATTMGEEKLIALLQESLAVATRTERIQPSASPPPPPRRRRSPVL